MGVALTQCMSAPSVPRKIVLLIIAIASVCSAACSNTTEQPTYPGLDVEMDAAMEVGQASPCESGSVKGCTIFLGRHGDLANCVQGLDVCSDGAWTGCIDEATLTEDPELYSELIGE